MTASAMKTVEIVSIGDELLRGIVQESNSYWLARRITARGAALVRATMLPDDVDIVATEIHAALRRAPDVVLTHGGLGPTDDDRTRAMIARGTDRTQSTDPAALAIVRRRYQELAAQGAIVDAIMTPERARMADLPAGAVAFDNQVGAAPSFALSLGATTLIALPGVPPELHWIWENSLAPLLDDLVGRGGYHEETIELELLDESRIAGLVEAVAQEHRDVYVKSRAHGFGATDKVRITLAAGATSDEEARTMVESARSDLRAALTAERIDTTSAR